MYLFLGVPKGKWVDTVNTKECTDLMLEFSSVLTNVWQLRVTPFLNSSSTTASVEFDEKFLVCASVFFSNCC